jgi:hypothetical protein
MVELRSLRANTVARSHSITSRVGYLARLSMYRERATSNQGSRASSRSTPALSPPLLNMFHGVSPNGQRVNIQRHTKRLRRVAVDPGQMRNKRRGRDRRISPVGGLEGASLKKPRRARARRRSASESATVRFGKFVPVGSSLTLSRPRIVKKYRGTETPPKFGPSGPRFLHFIDDGRKNIDVNQSRASH